MVFPPNANKKPPTRIEKKRKKEEESTCEPSGFFVRSNKSK
jgi:hypothetical protein